MPVSASEFGLGNVTARLRDEVSHIHGHLIDLCGVVHWNMLAADRGEVEKGTYTQYHEGYAHPRWSQS